jgi:predicted small integral membrane protein
VVEIAMFAVQWRARSRTTAIIFHMMVILLCGIAYET